MSINTIEILDNVMMKIHEINEHIAQLHIKISEVSVRVRAMELDLDRKATIGNTEFLEAKITELQERVLTLETLKEDESYD